MDEIICYKFTSHLKKKRNAGGDGSKVFFLFPTIGISKDYTITYQFLTVRRGNLHLKHLDKQLKKRKRVNSPNYQKNPNCKFN